MNEYEYTKTLQLYRITKRLSETETLGPAIAQKGVIVILERKNTLRLGISLIHHLTNLPINLLKKLRDSHVLYFI